LIAFCFTLTIAFAQAAESHPKLSWPPAIALVPSRGKSMPSMNIESNRRSPSTPGVGKTRSRVIAILVVLIVVATSIALRKSVSDQTTRVAIGIVEVIIIAIVMFRAFGRR